MPRYLVWCYDCPSCGDVCTYTEDESSIPDRCESCGRPTDDDDADE